MIREKDNRAAAVPPLMGAPLLCVLGRWLADSRPIIG